MARTNTHTHTRTRKGACGLLRSFGPSVLQAGDGSLVRQRGDALVAQIARLEPLLVAGAATYAPAVSGSSGLRVGTLGGCRWPYPLPELLDFSDVF